MTIWLDFSEYQQRARKTAVYPTFYIYTGDESIPPMHRDPLLYIAVPWTYPTLGLAGESGEVAEKVKKIARDDEGELTEEKREDLIKELGDILWYIANVSHEIGIDMNDVAGINIAKLEDRQKRNVLKGSGDNR